MERETEPAAREPIEELAESFIERYRRGEQPSVSEYAARYPHLAERIRELFPTLCMMEEFGPRDEPPDESEKRVQRLGEYRLLREIGRGGMGVVYEAEQETLRRHVALKVLPHPALLNESRLERFRQEAQAAARLHHTNIVPVFGFGEDRGMYFYAMQFIRGQSLAEVIGEVKRLRRPREPESRESSARPRSLAKTVAESLVAGRQTEPTAAEDTLARPSSPPRAAVDASSSPRPLTNDAPELRGSSPNHAFYRGVADIGRQVAEALAYAHGEGILHRDIKPSNLLLDTRGIVWVADFGLAKIHESDDLTGSGDVVGTLRYMAPERFDGSADARSDVYGVGITLYELLTLQPAYEDVDRARLVQAILSREPVPPRRLVPELPRDVETIVLKAIAREPRDRYATAADLADDLRRFLNYEPVVARRASLAERFWRWRRRDPKVAVLSAMVTLLLVTLTLVATTSAVWLRGERDAAVANLDRAERAERDARGRLVAAKLEEGRAWRRSRERGQRFLSVQALKEAVSPETLVEVRSELIGSLALMDLEEVAEWTHLPEFVVIDRHHERAALVRPDGSVDVVDADGFAEVLLTIPPKPCRATALRFSPQSRFLAIEYCDPETPTLVWDLGAGRPILELPNSNRRLAAAFSPDESRVAIGLPEGGVEIRSLPSGDTLDQLPFAPLAHKVAFAPGGSRLAVAGDSQVARAVYLFDLDQNRPLGRLYHDDAVADLDWSPSGEFLATACYDYKAHLWDTNTLEHVRAFEGHVAEVFRTRFSPDGGLLATASWDGRTTLWNPHTGEDLISVFGQFTSFRRGEDALGYRVGSERWGLWRLARPREYRLLPAPVYPDKGPQEVSISPDGKWLAAACGTLGARLWNLGLPGTPTWLRCGNTRDACFLPDGSALLTSSDAGLLRWSIRRASKRGAWRIGPPDPLGARGGRFAIDAEAKHLALIEGHDGVVYRTGTKLEQIARFRHANLSRLELTTSGRWLVTATWHGRDVCVWDVDNVRLIHRVESPSARASFSPDERWLAVGTGPRFTLFETDSWSERYEVKRQDAGNLPGPVAFSAKGELVSLARSRNQVEIRETATGAIVAVLEPPRSTYDVAYLEFSLDGGLLAASLNNHFVQIWNLRRIRSKLRAFGLDWGRPLPLAGGSEHETVNAIEVDYGKGNRWYSEPKRSEWDVKVARINAYTHLLREEATTENLVHRGELLEDLGALLDALGDVARAVSQDPADPGLRLRGANLLARLDRRAESTEELDQAVELARQAFASRGVHPARAMLARALRLRAQAAREESRFEAALADYEELVELVEDAREPSAPVQAELDALRRARGGGPQDRN